MADCGFDHIRDNAVEPAKRFTNWLVSKRRVWNVHAAISLDDVVGAGFVVAGRQFPALDKPCAITDIGGRVFKLRGRNARRPRDLVVAHNSLAIRSTSLRAAPVIGWTHVADAVMSLDPTRPMLRKTGKTAFAWSDDFRVLGAVADDRDHPYPYNKDLGAQLQGTQAEGCLALEKPARAGRPRLHPAGLLLGGVLRPPTVDVTPPDGRVVAIRSSATADAAQADGTVNEIDVRAAPVT